MELKIPNIQNLVASMIFFEGFLPGILLKLTFSSSNFFSQTPNCGLDPASSPLFFLGGSKMMKQYIFIYM